MSGDVDVRGSQAFPSTCWSRLIADPDGDSAAVREAFETLARRYATPIAAYVRTRWAKTDDDARDAAQEFFLWMLESGFLARADPARGRFRGFLKRSLANFVHDLERKRRTAKRGGTNRVLSLDAGPQDVPLNLPDPAERSPDMMLDDLWRKELLAQATESLAVELRRRGKAVTFDVFRDYYLSEDDLEYAVVARRYGISTTDVSNQLSYAKKRYRAHLRAAVLETVQGDDELRAEMAWLFEGGTT